MRIALALANRGIGEVAPNPSVGAVIVKNGKIIARARTAKGGRPHAETLAIADAGKEAKGSTIYVTLEPCSHQGVTGPCSEAIIKAGIKTVVVAMCDPYEKVNGQGIAKLKKAKLEVVTFVLEREANETNRGFVKRVNAARPFVSLKLATSADGKIADKNGNSKWITSEDSRAFAHMLRAKNDAILVGVGTVLKDDPELTCRLHGLEDKSPVRVILDSNLRTPLKSKIAASAKKTRTIIFYKNAAHTVEDALAEKGIYLIKIKDMKAKTILENLGKMGINNLLVEGGSKVAASFVQEKMVDEIVLFTAPKPIGKDGIAAVAGHDIAKICKNFRLVEERKTGIDSLKIFRK